MTTRRTHASVQNLATKSLELSLAAPQVVAQRVTRMMTAGPNPSARDQQEFMRMGNEKVIAFYESWVGMWSQAYTSYWQAAASMASVPQLLTPTANNPFAPFGVTSWEPFLANLIAFILMVVILRYLAFKPIQNVLEKRRQRIEEGEEMREESERQLASVKEQTHEMLVEAGEKGQEKIDAAKAAASRLLEEQETVASQKAEEIVRKARQLAELEQQKEREALKEQFGQLVALAAALVTGKMLTEEDQRRINREAIDSLDS